MANGLLAAALVAGGAMGFQGAPISEPALTLRDDIVFFEDFEKKNWTGHWSSAGHADNTELVGAPDAFPFHGQQSLKIKVNANDHYGVSLIYKCSNMRGGEPDEIYFRYYLKFDPDWECQGGKMPGFGGTYGRAGWGGRPVNGSDGWSSRGLFSRPRGDTIPIGYYCYHADMTGQYGSGWEWQQQNRGYLKKGVWYCVEGYVKLNTPGQQGQPGQKDGILRGWINGQLAFEKTDIRFRDVPTLKVENVWFNVYNGGTWTFDKDCHLYIDNVVIARKYIGPYVSMKALRDKLRPPRKEKEEKKEEPKKVPDKFAKDALEMVRSLASEPEKAAGYIAGLKPENDDDKAAVAVLKQGVSARERIHGHVLTAVKDGATASISITLAGMRIRAEVAGVDGEKLSASAGGQKMPLALDSLEDKALFLLAIKTLGEEPRPEVLLDIACFGLVRNMNAGKVKGMALWLPSGQDYAASRNALLRLLSFSE